MLHREAESVIEHMKPASGPLPFKEFESHLKHELYQFEL